MWILLILVLMFAYWWHETKRRDNAQEALRKTMEQEKDNEDED